MRFHWPTGLSARTSGIFFVFLVVPEAAGAFVGAEALHFFVAWIPDLDLGDAAEVDAAVAVLLDLPIDPHFEIAVVAGRGEEEVGVAVADEHAIFDVPMLVDAGFHFGVPFGPLFGGHGGDFGRVLGDAAGPIVEVFAVEEGREAFGGFVVFLCNSVGADDCEDRGDEVELALISKRRGRRECEFIDAPEGGKWGGSPDFSDGISRREVVGWLPLGGNGS